MKWTCCFFDAAWENEVRTSTRAQHCPLKSGLYLNVWSSGRRPWPSHFTPPPPFTDLLRCQSVPEPVLSSFKKVTKCFTPHVHAKRQRFKWHFCHNGQVLKEELTQNSEMPLCYLHVPISRVRWGFFIHESFLGQNMNTWTELKNHCSLSNKTSEIRAKIKNYTRLMWPHDLCIPQFSPTEVTCQHRRMLALLAWKVKSALVYTDFSWKKLKRV